MQGEDVVSRVIVVDDRPQPVLKLDVPAGVEVLRGRAAGPAAARNRGWRASGADWIAFLDDDVHLTDDWSADLQEDLAVPDQVGASQGRIETPRLSRPPSDSERAVMGLQS